MKLSRSNLGRFGNYNGDMGSLVENKPRPKTPIQSFHQKHGRSANKQINYGQTSKNKFQANIKGKSDGNHQGISSHDALQDKLLASKEDDQTGHVSNSTKFSFGKKQFTPGRNNGSRGKQLVPYNGDLYDNLEDELISLRGNYFFGDGTKQIR